MPSDSSDDDTSKFKDAIDSSLFSNELFTGIKEAKKEKPKSNRFIATGKQNSDLNISVDMQKRVGERVSKIIENQTMFVNVEKRFNDEDFVVEEGIKLFSDSKEYLNPDDQPDADYIQAPRKKIRKRTIDDDCDNLTNNEKIKASCLTSDFILSKSEVKHWKSRRKQKLFQYKKSGGTCTLIEK